MNTSTLKQLTLAISLGVGGSLHAQPAFLNTDWFSQAKYGVFMHFLPSGQEGLKLVEQADVKALARQLAAAPVEPVKAIQTAVATDAPTPFRVLVFSKTTGYRHASITNGIEAIRELGAQHGFAVDATEDSSAFTKPNLARYQAVVLLSVTGEVLDAEQKTAFRDYVLGGGGLAAIHGAAFGPLACEEKWAWYGEAFGCAFTNHSAVLPAAINVEDPAQPSTAGLPRHWQRTDEWYNFTGTPRGRAHVLATMDESTYVGGKMGSDHPIAWCRRIGQGRMWYTALGHTETSFSEPLFRQHLLGGIRTAAGQAAADFAPKANEAGVGADLSPRVPEPAKVAASATNLDYTVSWVGNSFSGAQDKWVQNFFIHMNTTPDGTCYTWSHWDEGGKKYGVYRDGDIVGNRDVKANSLTVKDQQGRTWTIAVRYTDPKHQEWDFVPKGIQCDGKDVAFPDLFQPTALALANDGQLMVADSLTGPRQQVLFYDISDPGHPKLTKTFGDYGGIAAGTPGQVAPTKFWGIRGIGMDAQGNLYVAMSEMGTVLRKFTPEGKMAWELYGHFFVDVACADPLTDGRDVWAVQEHYVMDYSQPAARQAKWVGYSLDRHKYPNDPRGLMFVKQQGEHGLTSPQVVYLKGRRFMFVGGMFASNFINIFRYDRDGQGEMAIPSGLIMQWGNGLYNTDQLWPPERPAGKTFIWRDTNGDGDYQAAEYAPNTDRVKPGPFYVDKLGNIWMAYGFFRYDFQGLDEQGNPIYSADKITVMEKPKGMANVARVCYDSDTDTLVAAEQGVEERGRSDMRHVGRIFVCRNYLAGNREAISFTSGAGAEAACVATAGAYVFTGGWKERGRVHINRLSDGAPIGVFDPGAVVGGVDKTGWVDILTGITAHQQRDGTYLVFTEEDFRAKSILYRWKP